jgi:hypothetical protein
MKKLISLAVAILVPSFILAGGMANLAVAADKPAAVSVQPKVLVDDAKVRVYETSLKPGDENTGIVSSSSRVIRVLQGGTMLYTYADGKKETLERKTGDVYRSEPGPAYSSKNVGKTDVKLYIVQLK